MKDFKTYKLQYYENGKLQELVLTGTEKKVIKEAKKILGVNSVNFKDNYVVPKGVNPEDYKIKFEFAKKPLNDIIPKIL
jgi:hypothetical protein